MAVLDQDVEGPPVYYPDVEQLLRGSGAGDDGFCPTQPKHAAAIEEVRRRLLQGAQLFPPVRCLPVPPTHCTCGLGVRFVQEACLEALLHEQATGEAVSLADVCAAFGLGYPYCCRCCALGHLDLLEVWSWLYRLPEQVPEPLGCHPALDFAGRTLRRLPLLPLSPVAQAWLATEGPGSRTQKEIFRALQRLVGVPVRTRARAGPDGVMVTVQQTVVFVGRLRERLGTTFVVPWVRVALTFGEEAVELPGLWPGSAFSYCRKGELPTVRGRPVDVKLCTEPVKNQCFVLLEQGEAVGTVHSCAGGRLRPLSLRLGAKGWQVRAPADQPPPPPSLLEALAAGPQPRRAAPAWVPMDSWLHWLAAASGVALRDLRQELLAGVRARLPGAPAPPMPAEALPQAPGCWRLEDVLPHAGGHAGRVQVLAELMAMVLKVRAGFAAPQQLCEAKAYRQRACVWEGEFRKHLARTATAALERAVAQPALRVEVQEDYDGPLFDFQDHFDFFASREEACDYAEARSLADGVCRMVTQAAGASCPFCGAARRPVCCHGNVLGIGHHVLTARPAKAKSAPPRGRRGLATHVALLLRSAPRELDRVLLGQSKLLRRQVAGRVDEALRESGGGKGVRRCAAPVPEQHDVHTDSLAVSDSGGSMKIYLRSCGRVLCAVAGASLERLRGEVGRLSFAAGGAEARLGHERLWTFRPEALGAVLAALRAAVVRAAAQDLELLFDAVVTHRWEGAELVAEVLVSGGQMAMAVLARPDPPAGVPWQELFGRGYLVNVVPNEFVCLREGGFAPDGLTFGLLDEELMCNIKLLQTPHGFGHCIRADYVRKGVAHGLTAAPLRWSTPAACSFQGLGSAVFRPNPRGLPLVGGAAPMTVIAGWKRDYGGQLQEDSFGVSKELFRSTGPWRLRVKEVHTRPRPIFEAIAPAEGLALDERGFPRAGGFYPAQAVIYRSKEEVLLAPRDCWVVHVREQQHGQGRISCTLHLLMRFRAGAGDKFLMAFQKFCAVPLERPLCTPAGALAGLLNSPSISSRNSEKVFVEGFVSHLALALGVTYHARAGASGAHAEVQALLCGEGCAASRLSELRRLAPGASLGCQTQAVDLRGGQHRGSVLTLPHTVYAAKQSGEEGATSCQSKVDRCWFDLMGARGFAPAVRSRVRVCSEPGCGALGPCGHAAPRVPAALSDRTALADVACRAMGAGLHVELSGAALPDYALVECRPGAAPPQPRQALLRETCVPAADEWRLEAGPPGTWSTGSTAAAEIVLDLLLADQARRGLSGFLVKGETHAARLREPPSPAALGRLAAGVRAWAAGLPAHQVGRGGGAAVDVPEAQAPEALAALRWGAEVLAVRRAILLQAPPLELRVVNRSYTRYEDCAEVVLADWLRRNLGCELLAPTLAGLPLAPGAQALAEGPVDLELRCSDDPVLRSTDFYVCGSEVRLFGLAVVLGPNPWKRGWVPARRLGGFRAAVVVARPCADVPTLWHMVRPDADLRPLVSASPALVAVCPPAPVFVVRKLRGMPRNLHCCRYGCFEQGPAAVRGLVEQFCDDCGDCKAEAVGDIEDAAARRGPVLLEQRPRLLRLRCATNEGLDDGAWAPLPAGPAGLPSAVRRLLAHDTAEHQARRAQQAVDLLRLAAAELAGALERAAV